MPCTALVLAISLAGAVVLHDCELRACQESANGLIVVSLQDPWCIPCTEPFLNDGTPSTFPGPGHGAEVGVRHRQGVSRIELRARYPPETRD